MNPKGTKSQRQSPQTIRNYELSGSFFRVIGNWYSAEPARVNPARSGYPLVCSGRPACIRTAAVASPVASSHYGYIGWPAPPISLLSLSGMPSISQKLVRDLLVVKRLFTKGFSLKKN